jgi:hypothetical protein
MKTEQLSDLAFDLVERSLTHSPKDVMAYLETYRVPYEDYDYFFVFMKHWIHVKVDLNFGDILMYSSTHISEMNNERS